MTARLQEPGVGGGSATFPITLDDGTYTYSITAAGGEIEVVVVDHATGAESGRSLLTEGGVAIEGSSGGTTSTFEADVEDGIGFTEFNTGGNRIRTFITVGDPNGSITATKGSPAYDIETPAIWQNTDGGTTWTQI